MRAQTSIVATLLFGSLFAVTGAAHAGDQEYPLSFVERPLTLPRLTLAPEIDFGVTHFSIPGLTTNSVNVAALAIGAGFGITDDLEVDVTLLPFTLTPAPVRYTGPTFGLTYRFVKGDVEVGAQVTATFNLGQDLAPGNQFIIPGVPVLIHIGKVARLDTGVFFPIEHVNGTSTVVAFGGAPETVTTPGQTIVGLNIPVRLALDVTEPFHVGVNSGLSMTLAQPGPDASVGQSVVIPLGFFAGYAIGEKRPIVDIDPFFQWIDLFTPGVGNGGDKVNPGIWSVGVAARGYIYL